MAGLLGRRCLSLEAGWGWDVGRDWAQAGRRKGARAVMALHVTDTNSPELGMQAALLHAIHWPIVAGIYSETGIGIGYTWTPYDAALRPGAIALGSHANAAIRLGLGWSMPLGDRMDWRLGLRLTHFSNGGITQPNLGTNQIDAAMAFQWARSAGDFERRPQPVERSGQIWRVVVQAGPRDLGLPRGPRALLTSARLLRGFPEALNNRAWVPMAGAGTTVAFQHNGRAPQLFVEAGGLWHFGRVDLMATWGGVLSGAIASQGPVFLQVDLMGQIRPNLALSLSLRSFRLRAEHPGLGVVWSL